MSVPPQVLIVERNRSLRSILARRFRADGYRVATASTTLAAFYAFRRAAPDLVLLDVLDPHVSGIRASLLEDHDFAPSQVMVTEGPDLRERVAFWRCS